MKILMTSCAALLSIALVQGMGSRPRQQKTSEKQTQSTESACPNPDIVSPQPVKSIETTSDNKVDADPKKESDQPEKKSTKKSAKAKKVAAKKNKAAPKKAATKPKKAPKAKN